MTRDIAMDYRFGPLVEDNATTFRLYAPSARAPQLILKDRGALPMEQAEDGFWSVRVDGAGAGTRYRFRSGELEFPDLASRQQEGGTNGWSIARKPLTKSPHEGPISPWPEAVFCEVHVGTVTPEGTFAGLMQRLEHFRDAGYNTLELMPIATFPGQRNWGYDGTLLFAPASPYGTPEELRALVDRAHELKLCIVLDVVYNHFGEVDNFAADYVPEWFSTEVETPWGPGINVDNPLVRRFYYENACMWLTEYDMDGLRFDAIHEIKTDSADSFLYQLAKAARKEKPSAKLIVENMENLASLLERDAEDEPIYYTAQWNDDVHHVLNFLVTGDPRNGYEDESRDPIADLEKGLRDGFIHDGEADGESDGHTGGEPGSELSPDALVDFVQNHDWIGNRPDGKRLADRISAEKLDFVQFVGLLAPQLPLFFMGEEAHVRSKFTFFVDLEGEAAQAKRDDRYKQMREIFKEDVEEGDLPDPNDPQTFQMSKLAWDEYAMPERQAALARFRELAGWRRELVWPMLKTKCRSATSSRHDRCVVVTWEFDAGWLAIALNPSDEPHEFACAPRAAPVSTGSFEQRGERLRLGSWSAVAWATPR
jgi:malto-oligosyltrehalose trehalohydrolase